MAPFGLKNVAHEAISASLVFGVAPLEAPEDGHLARVGGHGLDEGPDHHEEDQVEGGEQHEHRLVVFRLGQPDEEDVGVVDDADDPRDEHDEDVADEDLGLDGDATRHCCFFGFGAWFFGA